LFLSWGQDGLTDVEVIETTETAGVIVKHEQALETAEMRLAFRPVSHAAIIEAAGVIIAPEEYAESCLRISCGVIWLSLTVVVIVVVPEGIVVTPSNVCSTVTSAVTVLKQVRV